MLYSGAELSLVDPTTLEIVEGDINTAINGTVCVRLDDDGAGLERDILINVTTIPGNATSK